MQIENSTPHEQCCAAAPAGVEGLDWADVFPVRGGSGAAGPSMSTLGRFQDPMGTAWRSFPFPTGNLQRSFPAQLPPSR